METSITNGFNSTLSPVVRKHISHSRTASDIVRLNSVDRQEGTEIVKSGKESFRSLHADSPIPLSASNPNLQSAQSVNTQASTFEISVLKSEVDGMNKELTRYLDKCNSYEKDLVTYQGK